MSKINLFLILAFREQARKYLTINRRLLEREAKGLKEHVSALSRHIYVLSKLFNVHDFFENRERIESFDNPLIFHIPYGLENRDTGVEAMLLKLKGKVPIAARSYDPHSPVKMSRDYLDRHHDLVFTYNQKLVDNERFVFSPVVYDSFLVGTVNENVERTKFCCMILGNKYGEMGPMKDGYEIFDHGDNDIKNIYAVRNEIGRFAQVDVYGRGWDPRMENYRGRLQPFDRKYAVAQQYRFSVALENCSMRTLITEKILDCFLTLTVPVYLGATDIEQHISKSCFIDIRDFENYTELFDFLENMPESRYRAYVESILGERQTIFEEFSTPRNIAIPIYKWYAKRYGKVTVPTEEQVKRIAENFGRMRLVRGQGRARAAVLSFVRKVHRRFS